MLINKVDRLIRKDNDLKPCSKSQHHALTRNRFEINLLNNSLKKIENDFDKKNSELKSSINYTVQSFQLIKDSTGNSVHTIQKSRDNFLETNYQCELEKFHKEYLEPIDPDDLKALKVTLRTNKYRKKYSKMKPILTENEFKHLKKEKKDLNLSDWVKFKQKQYKECSDIDLSKFHFSDRNLYNAYLDAIDERDAYITIKSLSKKNHHQSDEIYLKQYRTLMKARVANTTPVFEETPTLTRPNYSRPVLNKLKQDLIKELNLKPFSCNDNKFNLNNQLNEKVKQFLRKC